MFFNWIIFFIGFTTASFSCCQICTVFLPLTLFLRRWNACSVLLRSVIGLPHIWLESLLCKKQLKTALRNWKIRPEDFEKTAGGSWKKNAGETHPWLLLPLPPHIHVPPAKGLVGQGQDYSSIINKREKWTSLNLKDNHKKVHVCAHMCVGVAYLMSPRKKCEMLFHSQQLICSICLNMSLLNGVKDLKTNNEQL